MGAVPCGVVPPGCWPALGAVCAKAAPAIGPTKAIRVIARLNMAGVTATSGPRPDAHCLALSCNHVLLAAITVLTVRSQVRCQLLSPVHPARVVLFPVRRQRQ